jgi:hypothetical protein
MLEAPVRRSGVEQAGHRQLMDVAQALERAAVDDLPFLRINVNEPVDRIADLMLVLGHQGFPARPTSLASTAD